MSDSLTSAWHRRTGHMPTWGIDGERCELDDERWPCIARRTLTDDDVRAENERAALMHDEYPE